MVASEQNTQDERREGVGRDQCRRFRLQHREGPAMAKQEYELRHRELHQDDAENEHQPRIAQEGFRLIDPKLNHGRAKKQKRDDEVLGRLR